MHSQPLPVSLMFIGEQTTRANYLLSEDRGAHAILDEKRTRGWCAVLRGLHVLTFRSTLGENDVFEYELRGINWRVLFT